MSVPYVVHIGRSWLEMMPWKAKQRSHAHQQTLPITQTTVRDGTSARSIKRCTFAPSIDRIAPLNMDKSDNEKSHTRLMTTCCILSAEKGLSGTAKTVNAEMKWL